MNEAQPVQLLLSVVILTMSTTITSVWSSEKNQNISFKPPATEQTPRDVTDVYREAAI
jgi:hypothetical protein